MKKGYCHVCQQDEVDIKWTSEPDTDRETNVCEICSLFPYRDKYSPWTNNSVTKNEVIGIISVLLRTIQPPMHVKGRAMRDEEIEDLQRTHNPGELPMELHERLGKMVENDDT